jgi:hypothetical protein
VWLANSQEEQIYTRFSTCGWRIPKQNKYALDSGPVNCRLDGPNWPGLKIVLLLAVLLVATLGKLARPGGVRGVMAETLVLKHQMIVSNGLFDDGRWEGHCRGLFELPVAA